MLNLKNICYIIGAGDVPEKNIIVNSGDFIICADGGYTHRKIFTAKADLIIGDFDSLGNIPNEDNTVVLPTEKDDTDMAFAVKEGFKRGFDTFVILGGLGGNRPDHSIANIQLLHTVCNKGGTAFLVSGSKIFTAVKDKKVTFSKECTGYISVFSLTDKSEGVTLRNLKYELSNSTLKNSAVLGVSNEFTEKEAEIEVKNGVLLLFWNGKITDMSI